MTKYNKASYMRKVDKILFTIGALGLQLNLFMLGMFPNDGVLIWNFLVTVIVLIYKFALYK